MTTLEKKYSEYKSKKAEYLRISSELQTEGDRQDLAAEMNVCQLHQEVDCLLSKSIKRASKFYRKIYNGSPTDEDIDKFLTLADRIIKYEDFISGEQLRIWSILKKLVLAHKDVVHKDATHKDSKE